MSYLGAILIQEGVETVPKQMKFAMHKNRFGMTDNFAPLGWLNQLMARNTAERVTLD